MFGAILVVEETQHLTSTASMNFKDDWKLQHFLIFLSVSVTVQRSSYMRYLAVPLSCMTCVLDCAPSIRA